MKEYDLNYEKAGVKDFNGYTMTNHTDLLDGVGKKEFATLSDFIDYVEKI